MHIEIALALRLNDSMLAWRVEQNMGSLVRMEQNEDDVLCAARPLRG